MVFKKKEGPINPEPQDEPAAESVPAPKSRRKQEQVFVCIRKCYFNKQLWNVEDETAYIEGIEKHADPDKPDCWFEEI